MRFYSTAFPKKTPPPRAVFPCVVLVKDGWDDFTYKTSFNLHYYRKRHAVEEIGFTKILDMDNQSTVLPDQFVTLSPRRYCSLGQSFAFYRALLRLGRETAKGILGALNDIVLDPSAATSWLATVPFDKSLLRESEAVLIWNEGRPDAAWVGDMSAPIRAVKRKRARSRRFTFHCRVPYAEDEHVVRFEFGTAARLPDRQNVLIGKNATGKTQVLRLLADALAQTSPDIENGRFTPRRPLFGRIVAVSYSAFDEFKRPPRAGPGSYRYCGIYSEKGQLIPAAEQSRIVARAIREIMTSDREVVWRNCLALAFGADQSDRVAAILSAKKFEEHPDTNILSSGHRILAMVLTQLVANMEKDALVLFDEPEMHLHPNAMAGLMNAIHEVLEHFQSYAIIATHSPLVLQQTPSRYVRVFERDGNAPSVYTPEIECFGENLTAITEDVFYARREGAEYRRVLLNLGLLLSLPKIERLFGRTLSFNARTVLVNAD